MKLPKAVTVDSRATVARKRKSAKRAHAESTNACVLELQRRATAKRKGLPA